MKPLTPREKEVYLFIKDYHEKHGYSPSLREIGKGVYMGSTRSVSIHLSNLIAKGYIEYTPRISRSIVLTKDKAAQ